MENVHAASAKSPRAKNPRPEFARLDSRKPRNSNSCENCARIVDVTRLIHGHAGRSQASGARSIMGKARIPQRNQVVDGNHGEERQSGKIDRLEQAAGNWPQAQNLFGFPLGSRRL